MMEDQTRYLLAIVDAVGTELGDRILFEDLSESDQLAIWSALGKAAWRATTSMTATYGQWLNEAWAEKLSEVRSLLPPGATLPERIVHLHLIGPQGDIGPEPDPWLDQYGAEE